MDLQASFSLYLCIFEVTVLFGRVWCAAFCLCSKETLVIWLLQRLQFGQFDKGTLAPLLSP